jgi:hypothetical protein
VSSRNAWYAGSVSTALRVAVSGVARVVMRCLHV